MNVYDKVAFDGKTSRPRGVKAAKVSSVPRTRPGATYPGGKHMRRSLKALARRTAAYTPTRRPSGHAETAPGSRKAY